MKQMIHRYLTIWYIRLLDTQFPRMDLLRFTGGRQTAKNMAFRAALPTPISDPMAKFRDQYNLTLSQTVALAGGSHNFGAAHSKCSGFIGQWTATPSDWFGPDSGPPSFFTDLLKEDWRFYRVCSFENNTATYTSIPNSTGVLLLEDKARSAQCMMSRGQIPIVCREQAMRGCDFPDGNYPIDKSPCDVNLLQMRLPSEFFLKTNPELLPFSKLFAEDAALFAEEFANAMQKITHIGLRRCGLSGHGCAHGHSCKVVGNNPLAATCVSNKKRLRH